MAESKIAPSGGFPSDARVKVNGHAPSARSMDPEITSGEVSEGVVDRRQRCKLSVHLLPVGVRVGRRIVYLNSALPLVLIVVAHGHRHYSVTLHHAKIQNVLGHVRCRSSAERPWSNEPPEGLIQKLLRSLLVKPVLGAIVRPVVPPIATAASMHVDPQVGGGTVNRIFGLNDNEREIAVQITQVCLVPEVAPAEPSSIPEVDKSGGNLHDLCSSPLGNGRLEHATRVGINPNVVHVVGVASLDFSDIRLVHVIRFLGELLPKFR